jgi:hypothetical protein
VQRAIEKWIEQRRDARSRGQTPKRGERVGERTWFCRRPRDDAPAPDSARRRQILARDGHGARVA